MILLFRLIGCLREIGFCEVIQSVIFVLLSSFERRVLSVNFDNSVLVLKFFLDTSYFFFRFCCSKITYRITKASQQQRGVCAGKSSTKTGLDCHFVVGDFDGKCLTILGCIFDRNLNRCVRPVILNLFAVL